MSGRLELLLEVTSALASATSEDAVARIVTSKGIAAVGASYGGVWLLDKDQLRLLAVSPMPRGSAEKWTTVPLGLDAPLPRCISTSKPLYIESLAQYREQFPESFARIQETISTENASYAMIPVADNGPPIGALAITYDRAGAGDPNDRTFLMLVGQQCALALRRIELLEAERRARVDAEEATRAREEILSVVSHDLRNPLGTILMGVSTLQHIVEPSDPKADRIRVIGERIQRQSERMARLIEDLVDFAGIQAGKLSIQRRATQPETVIAATSELFGTVANERGIGFSVDVQADLKKIEIDPDRALQVMSNLLANALKVTTKGGRVTIGAFGTDEVVFFVRDSGPGIEAEELPRLFERYWRSKKASYKGAGLGLSIARGIVDAHHGRIWAESQVGVGATFYFTLTPRS